jgi:DNA/RNA endonuclease G (NUC1)
MIRPWAIGAIAVLGLAGLATRPVQAEETPSCPAASETKILHDIEETIGLPDSHKDQHDPSEVGITCPADEPDCAEPLLICHEQFCTQYNFATKLPDWVIERLTPEIVSGKNKRPNVKFKPDSKLPDDKLSATDKDYAGSGLSRGHQAASADFKCKKDWMKQTFVFSNAVPQVQNGFNGGIWRQLESHVQNLAKHRDEIFVITGPVEMAPDGAETVISEGANACGNRIVLAGLSKLKKSSICDANDNDPSKACDAGVAVPAGLFMIIYVPETERTFGFVMSNEDHRKLKDGDVKAVDYFEEWRATIEVIEEAANLEFFTSLSLRDSTMRKGHCTETRWR